MIKLANIITEKELANHEKKDWINYVLFEPFMTNRLNVHANAALPTLIVGWNFFKKEFPHYYPDITHKTIPNTTITWEFSMDEKMAEHFEGVAEFVKKAPRKFVEIKPYRNIDPIKYAIVNEEHLFQQLGLYLNLFHSNVYQYKDEMIYIYDRTRFEITGIYLNAYRYFGFDTKKITRLIFDRVQQNQYNKAVEDVDGSIYQSYYKQFPDFDQLKRSLVLFLS